MKITESQLRKIVREEILRETAIWDIPGAPNRWESPHGLETTPYVDSDDPSRYRPKVNPKVGDNVQISTNASLDPHLRSKYGNRKPSPFDGMMGTIVKVPTSFSDRFYKVELENGEAQSFHDIDIKII